MPETRGREFPGGEAVGTALQPLRGMIVAAPEDMRDQACNLTACTVCIPARRGPPSGRGSAIRLTAGDGVVLRALLPHGFRGTASDKDTRTISGARRSARYA